MVFLYLILFFNVLCLQQKNCNENKFFFLSFFFLCPLSKVFNSIVFVVSEYEDLYVCKGFCRF